VAVETGRQICDFSLEPLQWIDTGWLGHQGEVTAIEDYIDHHNEHPKPFIWTTSASDILEKVKRARRTLVNVHSV
jgi:hypothetical protein